MKFLTVFFISILPISILGCDDSSSESTSRVTSSHAVGGDRNTMAECKDGLEQTAKKYNVTYTVKTDERDYFSGRVVKDGVETVLMVLCKKKDDYYTAMFEVPNW